MAEPENKELRAVLVDRIQKVGRISFAEFMDLVLYHPEHGYYNSRREKIGAEGDYYTSPCVHPIFGGLLACQLKQMWEILGRPSPFFIIEGGAGKGFLCWDILTHSRDFFPDFFDSVRYLLSDQSSVMEEKQKSLFNGSPLIGKIQWVSERGGGRERRKFTGCFLSNELIDSFPVHVVQQQEGSLAEIFITLKNQAFIELLGTPSSPSLAAYLDSYGSPLEDHQRGEVNLLALTWMEKVSQILERGFLLTIDYGFEARELYDPSRVNGTLLAYFRHSTSTDFYKRIGYQDITAHVNFTALIRKGEQIGLRKIGLTEQYKFLLGLGLLPKIEEHENESNLRPATEFLTNKLAMKSFLIPGGMGTLFKVLVQGKGVGNPMLLGFDDPLRAPRAGT
jgi:SAM-dependent MidA family methyltransferase